MASSAGIITSASSKVVGQHHRPTPMRSASSNGGGGGARHLEVEEEEEAIFARLNAKHRHQHQLNLSSPSQQQQQQRQHQEQGQKVRPTSRDGRHFRSSSSSVSPSSLQSLTTDSDSLQGDQSVAAQAATISRASAAFADAPSPLPSPGTDQIVSRSSPLTDSGGDSDHHLQNSKINNNNNNNNNNNHQHQRMSKSPILIKYNYYDYNGERQENHDLNNQQQQQQQQGQVGSHRQQSPIQRQLSPTFKQSLDQIVRSSQKHLAAANAYQQQQQERRQQQLQQLSQRQMSASPLGSSASNSPSQQQAQVEAYQQQQQQQQQQNPYTMTLLARRYKLSSYEHRCLRCGKTVYQMDKVGPLKDFTFYHQNCFKCRECGTKLTLKTYFNNQHSSIDQEVYCHRHCPKTPAGRLDNQSVGIRAALNAPKVFDPASAASHNQLLSGDQVIVAGGGGGHHNYGHHLNHLGNLQYYNNNNNNNNSNGHFQQPQVDSRALYIQHAVEQTRLQAGVYGKQQAAGVNEKSISQFLNRRLEYLEPKQKMLEARHREEEEQLFKVFEQKWLHEESCIRDQIREEWQRELGKLFAKHKAQMFQSDQVKLASAAAASSSSSSVNNSNKSNNQQQQMTSRSNNNNSNNKNNPHNNNNNNNNQPVQAPLAVPASKQQRIDFHRLSQLQAAAESGDKEEQERILIEMERMNLEKTMTIKLDKKKETLKRKLREFERQATAELVEKQSREMLQLISSKLEEFKEEQRRKIGSDLEHFEAIESLANHLGASLQVNGNQQASSGKSSSSPRPPSASAGGNNGSRVLAPKGSSHNQRATSASTRTNGEQQQQQQQLLAAPPLPKAPQLSKMELYNSEQPDEVFKDIDELAINVAKEDQRTFTDLVHHLTRHCLTDVEKVRAIFRWITVKNLNTMQFDSTIKADTPLGLLRGIKQGSESYHVLFKRLCSYAGLHCVVIKGYSKSAGYQPGVRFEGNRFRNSWNAVYVAGAWRFVQCNWGARHLVSVAVMQDKNNTNTDAAAAAAAAAAHRNGTHKSSSSSLTGAHNLQQPLMDLTAATPAQVPPLVSSANLGRRGQAAAAAAAVGQGVLLSPLLSPSSSSASSSSTSSAYSSPATGMTAASSSDNGLLLSKQTNGHYHHNHHHQQHHHHHHHRHHHKSQKVNATSSASAAGSAHSKVEGGASNADSLRYEYDDHYFLTDPDEFIYEFFPLAPEWQLLKSPPISLQEFEQLPFVRSLFFKYGLYFPQPDIRSVLYTNSSGAITIKIGMPTHMIPSLIFHYNLKYFDSDAEHHEGVSLKRFVMQSVESGDDGLECLDRLDTLGSGANGAAGGHNLLSNIVSFRVHVPENGAYILDIFANSTTPDRYITGEPMKFKSVCKFKIIARSLKSVMVPLPDCASGEYGPMKATRLFGIIPLTHENGLISITKDKHRFLEIQFRMTRPLLDFMASLHKNGHDERQLAKLIKIFIDGDIVFIAIKFQEDGQYGLDIYTRDQAIAAGGALESASTQALGKGAAAAIAQEQPPTTTPRKQLLTHCCKYLINVRAPK